jgi:uncharacterized protein YecT (DUF1311 family)
MRNKIFPTYIIFCVSIQSLQQGLASALMAVSLCSIGLVGLPRSAIASTDSFLSDSLAQTLNCNGSSTQLELNRCGDLRAKAADKKINQVYRQVKAKYKGGENEKFLIDAQLNWIKYRDSVCIFETGRFKGGSIAPLVYSNCIERMTHQRTNELETYLKEGGF